MNLPSKKIIPIIVACTIALGSIISAVAYSNHTSEKTAQESVVTVVSPLQSVQTAIQEIDSDKDGLKDWEESLWKTNPRSVDSDTDGTKDGEEVKEGRNPAVKGPNDQISTPAVEKNATTTILATSTPTVTGQLAKDLFAEYIELKKNNKKVTPEMENLLIQSVLFGGNYASSPETAFDPENLKIIKNANADTLKKYANDMGTILLKNKVPFADNELSIISKSLNGNSSSELEKLDIINTSYQKIVTDFINTPVPDGLASLHAELIWEFQDSIQNNKNLKNLFSDAASSLVGLKAYQETTTEIAATLQAISKYYKDKSISLTKTEPGYIFIYR